jgi:hydroxylamine reductase (hybrid-cluster protein)
MEQRMNEMLDRRRRLIKYTLKKERESLGGNGNINPDSAYTELVSKKNSVVTRFSSVQLEDLLTSSTKNVAHEVVSCMIPRAGENGLLLVIEGEI